MTIDGYKLIRKPRAEDKAPGDKTPISEIRVGNSAKGRATGIVLREFEAEGGKDRRITLRALGGAMATAIGVAEACQRKVEGLSYVMKITRETLVDEYEPIEPEEGKENKTITRQVPALVVELTCKPTAADQKELGFRAPFDRSEIPPRPERKQGDSPAGDRPERRRRNRRNRREGDAPAAEAPKAKPATPKGAEEGEGPRPRNRRNRRGGSEERQDTTAPAVAPAADGEGRRRGNRRRGGRGGEKSDN
eukprot:NODE_1919_length_1253_cov_167.748339_g1589_i0.p1 GENE.NODE_1919_length_1253_cov_167.748339_g1589_i0~~NODE_1919_length_1253_cov_167.748339_g1589_i0.p1  ORF type:complete len:249 (+),score=75.83 NODE_1919_length_1253_cov_167.748339_g1589_i0:149-895(+)